MSGNGRVNADHVTTSKLRFKWIVSQIYFDLLTLLYSDRPHMLAFFWSLFFVSLSTVTVCSSSFLIHISHSSRIWFALISLSCLPVHLLAQFLSVAHLFVIAHLLEHPFPFACAMVACLPVSNCTDEVRKLMKNLYYGFRFRFRYNVSKENRGSITGQAVDTMLTF